MAKSTRRTTKAKKTVKEIKTTPIEVPKSFSSQGPKSNLFSNRNILIASVIIIVALGVFYFKGLFVAATVNGQPITRLAVLKQLEKEGGKSVLDTMITNNLILQEADKEKVTATPAEVSAQVNQISTNLKSQGQDLAAALAAQGMTQQDLNDQVKLQILVQKMAGKGITVTDQEAQDYFNQNTASYPKGTKFDSVKDQIKNTLMQQKTSTAITSWVTNLKSKAKINHFVSY